MIKSLIKIEHDPDVIDILVKRAEEILDEFARNPGNDEDLRALAKQHANSFRSQRSVNVDQLRAILNQLRTRRKMTSAKAEVFLCTPAPSPVLKNLKALILLAALEHKTLFKDSQRSLDAMYSYRLLVEDREEIQIRTNSFNVEDRLPDTSQSFEKFMHAINHALKTLPNHDKHYADLRLGSVRLILGDLIHNRLKNLRVRGKSSRKKKEKPGGDNAIAGHEKLIFRQVSETEEMPVYQEISVQPAIIDETQIASEYLADNQVSGLFLATQPEQGAPDSLRRSRVLSAMHSKVVAGSIERREKRLVCLTNRLSRYEIDILIAELKNRMHTSDVAYVLYLVLATGRRPDTLLRAKLLKEHNAFEGFGNAYSFRGEDIFWIYRHELPAHRFPSEHQVLLNQQQSPVILAVPCAPEVMRKLPRFKSGDFEEQAKTLLKQINKENSTNLSIGKIADHLENFLHQHGVDDVVIALITGNPTLQEAGLYYSQYDTVSLYRAYQRYRECELQAETRDPDERKAKRGGSQLILTDGAVTGIFDHLKTKLQHNQLRGWAEAHNSYVMYTLHLLNLATGHRPVRDAFDDINHIDLISKKIFISDKESRFAASSARTLVLPDTAIIQIQLYIKHLEKLHIHMQSLSPDFAQQVRQTLNGEGPLLFWVRRGDSIDEIETDSVSPKSVESLGVDSLHLPTNWHRHFLRTYLLQQNRIPGEAIDTWMGHAGPGQEGFTKYSGMSIKALELIASQIEILFKKLGISPLTSQGLVHE